MTKRNMISHAVAVNTKAVETAANTSPAATVYMREHAMFPLLAMVFALALTGCQEDDNDKIEQEQYRTVELLMGMNDLPDGGELTRALPAGYSAFNPGTTDPGKIGMFMTRKQAGTDSYTYTTITGTYAWSTTDSKWKTNVSIKYDNVTPANNNYYAYGFMPAGGSITAVMTSKDFSAGGVMTLYDVPPVSAQDVCVITGILKGTPSSAAGETPVTYPSIEDVGITEGEYAYTASDGDNAIYILLKHIYSKYTLKMKVDADYDALRTIKVTNMQLSASAPAMNVDVTYEHASAPTVKMSALSSTSSIQSTVLSTETTLSATTTDLASFYCANALDYITLNTTFDVYDKAGNKVRSDCKTSNKIKVQNLEPGKHYTITATIKPTYLYQLSDVDLDKPTVVL